MNKRSTIEESGHITQQLVYAIKTAHTRQPLCEILGALKKRPDGGIPGYEGVFSEEFGNHQEMVSLLFSIGYNLATACCHFGPDSMGSQSGDYLQMLSDIPWLSKENEKYES